MAIKGISVIFNHKYINFKVKGNKQFINHLYEMHWSDLSDKKNKLLTLADENKYKNYKAYKHYKGKSAELQSMLNELNDNYRRFRNGN